MKKTCYLILLFTLFFNAAFSQPVWHPGTPATGAVRPLSVELNYGLDRAGTVYVIVFNSNVTVALTSNQVRTWALAGPSGGRVVSLAIPVGAGDINTLLSAVLDLFDVSRTHALYIVAEASGVLQATPVRLQFTTLPCPDIDILTGFSQPQMCVGLGATATFQVFLIDPPNSGILKGTEWTIDWGDGTPPVIYVSTADYQVPPVAIRQHTYSNTSSCNYNVTVTVRNPCGKTISRAFTAAVHGRDIPDDGNGELRIVNNATGSPVVQVCAGVQTIITLRDNSTWNCQGATVPNSDPRNIEWLYGISPTGTIHNTITGPVAIGSLGNAPQASGRMLPAPYGPSSLSHTIAIPATAVAGQTFRVYLKNWNKCNPGDAEFVYTSIDILVVPSPTAPTAPSRAVCIGEDRTLSVTSVPVGNITWYSDAARSNQVGTGLTYLPPQTTAGNYTYYVTDRETSGLLCESPATAVTLTINPTPSTPTISFPNKNNICYYGPGEANESYIITASVSSTPTVSGFQWFKDGVLLPGRTYDTIFISKPWETGEYTVRAVGVAPSFCMSAPSSSRYVTVHTLENVIPPVDQVICQNGVAVFHAETTMDIHSYIWEWSPTQFGSYSTVGNAAPYSGFNTPTLTISQPSVSFNGYWYRLEMRTPNGQGGCRFKSPPAMLTVDGLPTANAGANITRCTLTPLDPIPMTGASRGGSAASVVWSGGEGLGTWTQNMNPALATFTPSVPTGSFTATLTVTGTDACGGVVVVRTRNIAWSQTPVAVAGPSINRCDNSPLTPFTMTGASVSGTFASHSWSGGVGLGTWTQNSDPALAVFSPSVPSGSFTATLTVTGTDACIGTNPTATRTITWGETPAVAAGMNLSRCSLTPYAPFTMTGATASGTYTGLNWSGGAGLGTWTQNADPALATFTPSVPFGSFVATLSVTGSGACAGQNPTATRLIEWSHQATVNAGPDQSICATASATLAGTIGGSATSAVWSGGMGTFSPNNTTLNAVYTPHPDERAANTVTLTLTTSEPDGICTEVSDQVTIEIGTIPTFAVLTTSGDWCFGDGASGLRVEITGGAPPYLIRYRRDGINQPDIFPYESGDNINLGVLPIGIYSYQVYEIRDACGNIFNTAPLPLSGSFRVLQKPVANAGTDRGVCGILSTSLNAVPSVGTGTWSVVSGPGTITFTPGANSPAVTATASEYGLYRVAWTEVNGVVCVSSDTITVAYERNSTATATAQNQCGTLSAELSGNPPAAGTGTWSIVSGPGTASFSPDENAPDATVTVTEYGTYVFRWRLDNGIYCNSSADVTATFEKAADAGTEQRLCGTFTATLEGNIPSVGSGTWSLVSGPGTVSFSPNANTPAATATVSEYGTYVFNWHVANGIHCSTDDMVTIIYNPAGQVNTPADQVLCHGDNTAEIIFSTINIGGETTYTWTNSEPGIGLSASGSGDISSFQVVNTGISPVIATIEVTPTYSDGVIDCQGAPVTFTITVNPPAKVNPPVDLVFCNDVAATPPAFTTINTVGTTTYSWTNSTPSIGLAAGGAGNLPGFVPVNTGTSPVMATITVYPTFTYDGRSCADDSEQFTITVNPSGQVDQPQNEVVCHDSPVSVEFTTINSNGTTTYAWTNSNDAIGLPSSGSGNISFTSLNNGTAPVTATINVIPTYTSGGISCTGPSMTFTITVNPAGQIDQPENLTVCNGVIGSVAFITQNTVGTTTYHWVNDNADIGLGINGDGNLSFVAVNNGHLPVTANITVTPTFVFGGEECPGPSKTFTITVNPTPTLSGSLTPDDICSNTTFNYYPASLTPGTTFDWTRAVVAGITPATASSGSGNPGEILRNITNIPVGVIYQYTLNANGCQNQQSVVVNVKPEPVVAPGQIGDICSGNSVNHHINLTNFTNPIDNVLFTWPAPVLNPVNPAFSGGTARLSASPANISDVFTNTMGVPGTATYTVTPYKDGCPGEPETIVLTIRPQPVLDASLNDIVCSNTPIGLILKEAMGSVSADHYNISGIILEEGLSAAPGNAFISNPAAPADYLANDRFINITGVNKNVTYRVQPVKAPDCFGATVDVVITIRPQPYIVPAQTKTVCSGFPVNLEVLLSPANIPAGTIFNWPAPTLSDFSGQGTAGVGVTANPSGKLHITDVIYNTSGAPITATYYITPTSVDGCTGTEVAVIIIINPEPLPVPITGRDKICAGETNLVYTVPATLGSLYTWTVDPAVGTKVFDFGSNAVIINAAAVPGAGNITVYETNLYGCSGAPTVFPVEVYEKAVAENVSGESSVCAGSTHTYSVTSRAGSVYSWSIPFGSAIAGDPSAATVTVIFGTVGGNISVTETNIAGCITVHNPLPVTVRPLPSAIISGAATICDGGSGNLTVDFTGTAPFTFVYAINGVPQPPVTTSDDPYQLEVTQAGTYTIQSVTDATGCTGPGFGTGFITYHFKPIVSISGGGTICAGDTAMITVVMTGTVPFTVVYTDGTTNFTIPGVTQPVLNIKVTPAVTSTYTLVSVTDGNGCLGLISGSAPVTVNEAPQLTLSGIDVSCYDYADGAIDLTITGSGPFGIAWTGPGGFVANTEDLSGLKSGTYNVTVTSSTGCRATAMITLSQPAPLTATLNSTNILCYGQADGTITITNPSGGTGIYEYSINGGSTWHPAGNFTNLSPGSYDVRIRDIANPLCIGTLNAALEITSLQQLAATVTHTDIVCHGSNNGTITISSPSGGSGMFEFSVNGGTDWQGTGTFTGLPAGTYQIWIRDAVNTFCYRVLDAALEITQPAVMMATVVSTNVSCFGGNNGTIEITAPAGGSGVWQYSADGGTVWQSSPLFINLAPGTYVIRMRDAIYPSCSVTLNADLVITQPDQLTALVASTNVNCYGGNDGTITISSPAGGYGTYDYSINGGLSWQPSGSFSGLIAGTYNVRIRDAVNTGCIIILDAALVIGQPAPLTADVSVTNVTCYGGSDGILNISSPAGGSGSYEYSIDGGTIWQLSGSFTGLPAGYYSVQIRDAAFPSCSRVLVGSLLVSQPQVLSAIITPSMITCNGASDGSVIITMPSGGSGTYEYTIDGGLSWHPGGSFTMLSPATYDVRMRDAVNNGCIMILNSSLIITEPDPLTATVTKSDITCFAANDGRISITAATGGTGSYRYSIDGGTTWQGSAFFTGLIPGNYSVMIMDALHPSCMVILEPALVISEPGLLTAVVSSADVNCFGTATGSITISSPVGGYGTYGYSINGGLSWSASGNFTGLPAGTYDIRIRDASNTGCVIILNPALTISQPDQLGAVVTSSDVTCFGGSDGSIIISSPVGGSGSYEYSIDAGLSWHSSGSFINLPLGFYNVLMRDAMAPACIRVLSSLVIINQPGMLNAVVTPAMVSCNGGSDGRIIIQASSGGSGSYEYSHDGGMAWQSSGTFDGLPAGTYNVMMRDASAPGCMITLNAALVITEPAILGAIVSSTHITCNGVADGTINITFPSGGYGTYDYSINGGTTWQVTGQFTGLPPGSYDVAIRDRANPACVRILSAGLLLTEPPALTATVNHTDVTCFGANNGTITISAAAGGYGTYTYSVNGGASWQASGNFNNLMPGSYNVMLRDAANPGCTITLNANLIVSEPAVLSALLTHTNVTCFGTADGTITIASPSGGSGLYEYTITGGTTWQASGEFTGLAPGYYNVQVRDAVNTGCILVLNSSYFITQPPQMSALVFRTNVTCNGSSDGTITISAPTGGSGSYEYTIDGGTSWQLTGNFTGLAPGTYSVGIRDAASTGCVIILNAGLEITQPGVLAASINTTMVSCFNGSDGRIMIESAAGGSGFYQYTINGGTTWQGIGLFQNLAAGTYDVRIRDASNTACEIILDAALLITQPAELTATVASSNVTCFGASDGEISISSPTGGTGSYEYSINGGSSWQASGDYQGLPAGFYNILMRDAAVPSCVKVLNNLLIITQPAILVATATPVMVSCNGAADGQIVISGMSGGSGIYEYSIDGGSSWSSDATFSGVSAGTYNVVMRDAAAPLCVITINPALVVTQPAILSATVSSANVTCLGVADGTITVTLPSGGYGTYDFSIDGGASWQPSGHFSGLSPGLYDVAIRDRAHPACVQVIESGLNITGPALLSANVASTDVTCFAGSNGTITITSPSGGYGTYSYSINGGASWQPSGNFTGLTPGTYVVMIRDAAHPACEILLNGALVITQPDVLAASVTHTNVTCYGLSDGSITITSPTGGSGSYEYTINGGTTWQTSGNFTGLAPGFYNIQIRDAVNTGCVITLSSSYGITQPQVLSAIIFRANVTCSGGSDGTITVTGPTGGSGSYEYTINGGADWQTTGSYTGLAPGTYSVGIRDAASPGCIIILNPALEIIQPGLLTATISTTMVSCFNGSDGRILIESPSGGSGFYHYSINGGTSWQGLGMFLNLQAGTYDVRMRDAAEPACEITLNPALVITEPAELNATSASTNPSCFGAADGTITISAPSGGSGSYEYSVNGGGTWQPSGTFTGLGAGTYIILMRDAVHTGCMKILASSYTLTQPPMLTATVSKTDVTCMGENDGTITVSSPSGGYGTYEFTVDGGLTWQSSGVFTGLAPGSYNVRMRDALHNGCTFTLFPNLMVNEPLLLELIPTGDITLSCYGEMSGIGSFFSFGGTMPYSFTVLANTTGATMPPAGFSSQSFFSAGAGIITVRVTDARGCTAEASIAVTQPDDLTPGSVGINQVICSGTVPAELTELTAPAGGPAPYSYQWQYSANIAGPYITIAGATGSTYTPPAGTAGTLYYRRMVTSGSCSPVYSNSVEIVVNPLPVAMLTGGATICPGETATLAVSIMTGTGPFEVEIENHGTVTGYMPGDNITVSPLVTTTYRLMRVRDANGCEVTSPSVNLTGNVTVTVSELPVITSSPTDVTVCEYEMVVFTANATGTNITWQWYVDEGSGFVEVTDGGSYAGAATRSLSIFGTPRTLTGNSYRAVASGCSASATTDIALLTVNTAPDIRMQPADSTICTGADASFTVFAEGTGLTYRWQVNTGTGFTNVIDGANFSGADQPTLHVLNAPGLFNNYLFRVIVEGVCGAPAYSGFAMLRVYLSPVVSLQPVARSVCAGGGPASFLAYGSGLIDSTRWQVNDGSGWTDIYDNSIYTGSATQQLTLFDVPSSYNGHRYRLALKGRCVDVYTNDVVLTVNANPVVDFSAIDPVEVCGGTAITLNGNPTGGSGSYTQHRWTGDVGPLSSFIVQQPQFRTTIGGTYNLTYSVTDSYGCSGSGSLQVIVERPVAMFAPTNTAVCTGTEISFVNGSLNYTSLHWDFGDGFTSTELNPSHTYVNNTSAVAYYDAVLTATAAGGCTDKMTVGITVYPASSSAFNVVNDTICSGEQAMLVAAAGGFQYHWLFGDGQEMYTANNVVTHAYVNATSDPVTHTVTLTVSSLFGCSSTTTGQVTVYPRPVPQFTASPATQTFPNATVTFTNLTNTGNWTYLWNFGDGITSSDQNPLHVYTAPGDYTVTLTVSNLKCAESVTSMVRIMPTPPIASFAAVESGCEPLTARLVNTSQYGTAYFWDFGDGTYSTERNPEHTWYMGGIYTVTLTVTGPGGVDIYSNIVEVYRTPVALFRFAPETVYANDQYVRFYNLSHGASYFIWHFGDGDTSHLREPAHKYMMKGVYDITLHAYSDRGCIHSLTVSPGITVESAGDIRFPTAFRPNKDGPIEGPPTPATIDMFFFPPVHDQVIEYKLQIFNRWGMLIFESRDINVGWNGYYKGVLCQQGVYVWLVEGKYSDGRPFKKAGDVTLLR